MSADILIRDEGSLVLLVPTTAVARDWLVEHVSRDGYQPLRPTIVCERRYVLDIVEGLEGDGLTVEVAR
jgi:hypothetical protein